MKRRTPIVLVLMISAVTSCYYDKEETLYGRKTDCNSVNYTYATDVGPLIAQTCSTSGCHDATNAGNVTLQSYAQAKENSARINQRVVIDRTMPPAGGLTAAQISMIECWITKGAPQ